MSNIIDLIQNYCPNGVEYKPLWMVTAWDKRFKEVDNEKQKIIVKYPVLLANELFALQQEDGDVFLLSTGSETGWTNEELAGKNLREGEIVAIPWGKAGTVNVKNVIKYYKGKFVTGDNRIMTSLDTSVLNNRFLYHVIEGENGINNSFYRGSGIKHPDMRKVLDLEIPVPPLPVQEEIVRILDKFTELESELEQELELRKKQYEYYRDKMLSLSDYDGEVESCTLGDIAFYPKDRIDASDLDENNYVGVDNMLQHKLGITVSEAVPTTGRWSKYSPNDVLIGNIRPYLRKIWLADREGGTNGDVVVLRSKDEAQIYPRFLYHICASERFFEYDNSKSKGAKMPRGNKEMIPLFEVVVPKDINEQIRITDVLDKFDKLTSDISEGLPAEIKMRHQQYEYYRDKLLNFKRLEGEPV